VCDNGGTGAAYKVSTQEVLVNHIAHCDVLAVGLSLGELYPDSNDPIVDLSPLRYLQRIEGDLNIGTLYHVQDLSGLDSLEEVTGRLDVGSGSESALESLDGLTSLYLVGGTLEIFSTYNLRDVSELHDVTVGGDYNVTKNHHLCQADAVALFDAIDANGFDGDVLGYINNGDMRTDCPL